MNNNQNIALVTLAATLSSINTLYVATDPACDKVCGPALTTAYLAITGLANDNGLSFATVEQMADKFMRAEAKDASDAADAVLMATLFGPVL
jgi:hypothetical protein